MDFATLDTDKPGQAFLTSDDEFAALDSMVPHTLNTASGNSSSIPVGNVSSGGIGGGFAGVSESLFDRIRAKTAEHQQQQRSETQYSLPQQVPTPQYQQISPAPAVNTIVPATGMNPQQHALAGSMPAGAPTGQPFIELERRPEVSTPSTRPTSDVGNTETYSYAGGPCNFAPPPAPPTYGPSRNWPSSATSQQSHPEGLTMQGKHSNAWEKTSDTMGDIWKRASAGAHTLVSAARGAGNKHGLLDREEQYEGPERGEGIAAPSHAVPTQDPAGDNAGPGARDQAYSMVSYGKTFCEDMAGFIWQLPVWGKLLIVVLLLWAFFTFRG